MSGDHNMHQKDKSYLDFECPRCGHCCQNKTEAMQQALDMLNEIADEVYCDQRVEEVITALEQALEAERNDLAKVGVWGEVKPIYKIEGVGECGLDLGRSPGVGPYYVRLYDGRYDASGFDTEQEAREELEYVAGLPRKNT